MNAFTTTALRIAHGGVHMPASDGTLRAALIVFGTLVTLSLDQEAFALLAGIVTATAAVITLWELHETAIECERLDDEDQDDDDECGFGMAA